MAAHGVKTLIYSSTCATYGEPEKMPITEDTPQVSMEFLFNSSPLAFLCYLNHSLFLKYLIRVSMCVTDVLEFVLIFICVVSH